MIDVNFITAALEILLNVDNAHPESTDRLLQGLCGWAWDIGREQAERETDAYIEGLDDAWEDAHEVYRGRKP